MIHLWRDKTVHVCLKYFKIYSITNARYHRSETHRSRRWPSDRYSGCNWSNGSVDSSIGRFIICESHHSSNVFSHFIVPKANRSYCTSPPLIIMELLLGEYWMSFLKILIRIIVNCTCLVHLSDSTFISCSVIQCLFFSTSHNEDIPIHSTYLLRLLLFHCWNELSELAN